MDLHHAAEAMAVILGGSAPKQDKRKRTLDIRPTLRTRAHERETNWRIPQSVKRLILADVNGEAKLPIFRVSG